MADRRQNLYIPIDSLLDTRFAMMYQRFPRKFRDLDMIAYVERPHNRVWEFIGVSKDEWLSQWEKRDLGTLKSSQPTLLMAELAGIISTRYFEGKTSPVLDDLVLHLNIYPYLLNDDVEALIDIIREWTFDDLEVKVVSTPPELLTPQMVQEHYQVLFMDDWAEWVAMHVNTLRDTKMPTVTFYPPSYLHETDTDAIMALQSQDVDPFKRLKGYMAPICTVTWMSPELYTLPRPV